jgi:hypothetical protein
MKEDKEWGPWVKHDGSSCPLKVGTLVHAVYTRGDCRTILHLPSVLEAGKSWVIAYATGGLAWVDGHVSEYRVKKPKGLVMLEELLEDLPIEIKEKDNAKV